MKLDEKFFMTDGITLAQNLLGKNLVTVSPQGIAKAMITETEAYMGHIDPACHSCKRKPTSRTKIIFGHGGRAYIYLIYGLYLCFNITANTQEFPEAVLIRGLLPTENRELMRQRRGGVKDKLLCDGPGKLCIAMGITMEDYGQEMWGNRIYVEDIGIQPEFDATPRINIDYAGAAKDYLWRFVAKL